LKTSIAIAVLISSLVVGAAQQPVPEPEFAEVFVALDSGKLIPLERQTASVQGSGGGFMVASSKAAYVVAGNKSPVRFHSGQALDFVVRTAIASTTVDPSTLYVLRKMDSKKKNREIVFSTGHFSPLGGSVNTNLAQGSLPVTFTKYGASSIKVTAGALSAGEYALSRASALDVFCFGVD
jgi:hypothetical protein